MGAFSAASKLPTEDFLDLGLMFVFRIILRRVYRLKFDTMMRARRIGENSDRSYDG